MTEKFRRSLPGILPFQIKYVPCQPLPCNIPERIFFFKIAETILHFIASFLGCISLDEFKNACEVLNQFSHRQVPLEKINDLARSLDINKDGMIDFNEFLEAFRLVSQSVENTNES